MTMPEFLDDGSLETRLRRGRLAKADSASFWSLCFAAESSLIIRSVPPNRIWANVEYKDVYRKELGMHICKYICTYMLLYMYIC